MYKNILSAVFCLLPILAATQAISIATARAMPLGSTVTVRGLVTNGAELGKIRCLQDGTAGVAAFPGTGSAAGFEANVGQGDSVEITGVLTNYQGLLEITPISAYTVLVQNLPLPAPKIIHLTDWSDQYESQLVGMDCITFADGAGLFSSSGAYVIHDLAGNSAELYLRSGHPLLGATVPGTPIFLTGILTDFNGFQLLPRTNADFQSGVCFYFTEQLFQSEIAPTSFHLTWETSMEAISKINYGKTPALGSSLPVAKDTTFQSVVLEGLEPGAIYWVQIESERNAVKILSEKLPFATKSNSSGQIKVFFNKTIDLAYANGFQPDGLGAAAVLTETINRINACTQTLDVAMYNNGRSDITTALLNAHNRGVRVRYIASESTSNSALLPAPPFPVLYGNQESLMHDKFIIADVNLPDKAWVMSGSLNWTNQNINTDFNNTLFIQDQSLARAYQLEFEEMWGSNQANPDVALGRFGSNKTDNTPHQFVVGESKVALWFSPSDRTTDRIVDAMRSADQDIFFATFSFTKNEIGDALIDAHNSNIEVRGMIENISDPGVEIGVLNNAGIDCRPHVISGDLHHKYAVIDANNNNPMVITGSHNWTFTAETANDENTLIIENYRLASLFKAEFEKRWLENTVSTGSLTSRAVELFPNPTSTSFILRAPTDMHTSFLGQNILGQSFPLSASILDEGSWQVEVAGLASGYYLLFFQTNHERFAVPFQKI
jgi:phosphatidylserine/phosphatidylglycerophosphate/cardiolipin synthase-like enzyme